MVPVVTPVNSTDILQMTSNFVGIIPGSQRQEGNAAAAFLAPLSRLRYDRMAMKTFTTATHWGFYEHERSDDGPVIRPLADDADPPLIGDGLKDMLGQRARIATPLVRASYLDSEGQCDGSGRGREPFVSVSWDQALGLAVAGIERTRAELGNEGIYAGSYGWASAGRFHHAQSQLKRFMNLAGGFVRHVNTYSSAAGEVIIRHVLGDGMRPTGHDWPTIRDNTELLVTFGGLPLKNTMVDPGGTGPHVDRAALRQCMEEGLQVASIGPMLSEDEAELGAHWLAPRPNTDVALMLALAHVLVTERRHDASFLDRYCVGADDLIAYVTGASDGTPKDPDWASVITGVPANAIVALAREMTGRRTLITITWAMQRADHGEQPFWMAMALAALLGQLGLPGGGIAFGLGTFSDYGAGKLPFDWSSLPQGHNPVDRLIPVARIADMLLNPGMAIPYNGSQVTFPEIGLVYWAGGNPFHHHQDLHRLSQAFRRPKTVIVNDAWFQSTARFADIVLPATTTLERNDFAASAHGGYAAPMHKAIEPFGEALSDFDIFTAMAERLGFVDEFTEGCDEMAWIRHIYLASRDNAAEVGVDLPDFDTFWSNGWIRRGPLKTGSSALAALRNNPLANPLTTPTGKVELVSETIDSFGYADCGRHPMWIEPREWLGGDAALKYPLHLLSDQPSDKLHSQLDSGKHSAAKKVQGRQPILMHPGDAELRGISDGDIVHIFNTRGRCLGGARLTDRVIPGVVVMSTGAWFDTDDAGNPGSLERHGNPNVLTYDAGCSSLSQGPSCNTALVEVERYEGKLPPIEVYDIPLRQGGGD